MILSFDIWSSLEWVVAEEMLLAYGTKKRTKARSALPLESASFLHVGGHLCGGGGPINYEARPSASFHSDPLASSPPPGSLARAIRH